MRQTLRLFSVIAILFAIVPLSGGEWGGPLGVSAESSGSLGSSVGFTPVIPARLADTRPGAATIDGQYAGLGASADDSTLDVRVLGRGGVPADGVDSVVLNVVALDATANDGYLTVFPGGSQRPNSSSLNYAQGPPRSVAVLAKVGVGGVVSIYAFRSANILVDVVGWFPTGGSFSSVAPSRLADTRPGAGTVDGLNAGGGRVKSGDALTVPVLGRGGVPSAEVVAVAVTVTATAATGTGYLTLHQAGTARPNASNLNYVSGLTVANLTVLDVSSSGAVSVFASQETHVIVDIVGWFAAGEFTGVEPARVLDQRPGGSTIDGSCTPGLKNTTGETLDLLVAGRGGVPATGAGTVILNLTAVDSRTTSGYVTVHAGETPRPNASSLNFGIDWEYVSGQYTLRQGPVANLAFAQLGTDGTVSLYTWGAAHLLVDVVGWLPGVAVASGTPCPIPAFDADTIELEWIEPLTYSTKPASNDPTVTIEVLNGRARVTPPLYKLEGAAAIGAGVTLKSSNGQHLASFSDNATRNNGPQQEGSQVQQFGTSWSSGVKAIPGTYTVAQVCVNRGASNVGNYVEDCRAALPHEAITYTIPAN